jgi:hypothetical protein
MALPCLSKPLPKWIAVALPTFDPNDASWLTRQVDPLILAEQTRQQRTFKRDTYVKNIFRRLKVEIQKNHGKDLLSDDLVQWTNKLKAETIQLVIGESDKRLIEMILKEKEKEIAGQTLTKLQRAFRARAKSRRTVPSPIVTQFVSLPLFKPGFQAVLDRASSTRHTHKK